MIIESKYFTVCPMCQKNINVGARVEWEKGTKAIHVECMTKTTEELMELFKETHKTGTIEYLNESNGISSFKWTMKSGKEKLVQYYSNGDRYYGDKPPSLLGVR